MRAFSFLVLIVLAGCATTKSVTPREYLDEQTAATITVVADPWIFTRRNAAPQLDFFNLYAIDVNRMGDHRKYFAIVHYWPSNELAAAGAHAPTLVLTTSENRLSLEAAAESPRELGIAQPLDKSAPSSARTWLYPVDHATLQSLARNRDLSARLIGERLTADYAVWRDGSTELSEFATAFDR